MKRCLLVLLAVTLLWAISGCAKPGPQYQEPDFKERSGAVGDFQSDVEGLSLQFGGLYVYPDKTELVIVWSNQAEYPVEYGAPYWIQRLENGEWVSCALKETAFTTEAYSLAPGKSKNRSYSVSDIYDLSKPGTYWFLTSCTVHKGDGTPTDCPLWAEFTLK